VIGFVFLVIFLSADAPARALIYTRRVHRLFSAFPSGWPGLGLFCLRFALPLILIGGIAPTIVAQVVLGCAAAMVIAGFLTPFASGVVAAVALGTAGWSLFTGAPLLFGSLRVHGLLAGVASPLRALYTVCSEFLRPRQATTSYRRRV